MADELKVNVDGLVPEVGDSRRLKGAASARTGIGAGLEFSSGDTVRWALELRRILGGVEIEGDLHGTVGLVCYRCLEPYEHSFSLGLLEHALVIPGGDIEPGDDYADEYLVQEGVLDLEPVFRDAICLAIPSKHLCGEECMGLCQGCGANLNAEPCTCAAGKVDRRLLPLEDLKRRLEEEGRA